MVQKIPRMSSIREKYQIKITDKALLAKPLNQNGRGYRFQSRTSSIHNINSQSMHAQFLCAVLMMMMMVMMMMLTRSKGGRHNHQQQCNDEELLHGCEHTMNDFSFHPCSGDAHPIYK